jgi:uncharacterized protein
MAEEFIGKGWGFPLSTTSNGSIALVSGDREIEESIRIILSTAQGERPMRPEFGCGIHDHIFAPADATTAGIIVYEVQRALARWEPRISVREVQVSLDRADDALIYITVNYSKRGTNDPRNLVFPFYVIPEES